MSAPPSASPSGSASSSSADGGELYNLRRIKMKGVTFWHGPDAGKLTKKMAYFDLLITKRGFRMEDLEFGLKRQMQLGDRGSQPKPVWQIGMRWLKDPAMAAQKPADEVLISEGGRYQVVYSAMRGRAFWDKVSGRELVEGMAPFDSACMQYRLELDEVDFFFKRTTAYGEDGPVWLLAMRSLKPPPPQPPSDGTQDAPPAPQAEAPPVAVEPDVSSVAIDMGQMRIEEAQEQQASLGDEKPALG